MTNETALHEFMASQMTLDQFMLSMERELVMSMLNNVMWNRTEASRQFGTTFRAIRYRLHKLGIEENGAGQRKTPPGFSKAWPALREAAFKAHGYKCSKCGALAKHGATLHVDHILPIKFHPTLALNLTNLQVLCSTCNISKGSSTPI